MPPIAELAYAKAQRLLAAGCVVSEFGTRRRRAFAVQDTVVAAFVRAQRNLAAAAAASNTAAPTADTVGKLAGTSNVRSRALHYSSRRLSSDFCGAAGVPRDEARHRADRDHRAVRPSISRLPSPVSHFPFPIPLPSCTLTRAPPRVSPSQRVGHGRTSPCAALEPPPR